MPHPDTQSWTPARVGDFLKIKHGFAFKGDHFRSSGELIVLTPGNFGERGEFLLKPEKEKYYNGDFPKEFLLRKGELLVVMTDLTQKAPILGSASFIPEDDRYLHNQRLGKVVDVDLDKVDKTFLRFLFNSRDVREQIKASASGATVRHTSPSRIYEVQVRLPPPETQRRIASILSAYDDLIENNTRRIAILEEIARRVFEEWFVEMRFPGHGEVPMVDSALGLLPEGWEVTRFDSAMVLQRGFDLPTAARQPGPYPVLAATGRHGSHSEAKVKGPGVVTGRSGSLGTVIYVTEDFWPLNTALWVKEFRKVSPLYGYFMLSRTELKSGNSGAAVPSLNRNVVHQIPVYIPPAELIKRFDAIVQPMLSLKYTLDQAINSTRATRDLLLPRLISGEIDVSKVEAPKELEAA